MERLTGEQIKGIRLKLGESQVKFAERFGVSYMTVGNWERNLYRPLPCFEKILRALLEQ